MNIFSAHYINRNWREFAGLITLIALLYLAAAFGMAYVAGFSSVEHRLEHAQWWWLALSLAALAVGFCGYYFAYRGVERVERGPELEKIALLPVVIAGFGGVLARGGTALDEFAMRAGGAGEREAKVRIGSLAGFEHGMLAMIVCPAAIAALAAGVVIPRTDLSWPWATIPIPAAAIVIWLAARHRDRLRARSGWRGRAGMFFDATHLVVALMRSPRRHGLAIAGMASYWAAEMFALWAATATFGFRMTFLSVILALGTGMLLTRRTAPLAGAGLLMVALVPTLWYGAAVPYAAATLGVSAYYFLTLWIPLPASLAALPKLRELARISEESSRRGSGASEAEPALQH